MVDHNCSIIVSSFDGYSDVWKPFFTLFFRYWPDCPYPVYLISNTNNYEDERVEMIHIDPDRGWSGNLVEAIKRVNTDYIIYFQEDYFLTAPTDTARVAKLLEYAQKEKAAYMKIKAKQDGPAYRGDAEIGEIETDDKNRTSTQTAIWDRKVLMKILDPRETGWDFELKGGLERSRLIKAPFLASRKSVINYFATAIVRGRYLYDAAKLCEKEGIVLNTKARRVENYPEFLIRKMGIKRKAYKVHLLLKKIPGYEAALDRLSKKK